MMKEMHIWPVCIDAYHAISKFYVPAMNQKAAKYDLSADEGWLILPALSFDPQDISAEKLRIRSPYTSFQRYDAGLKKLAKMGFLDPVYGEKGAYQLTSKGKRAVLDIVDAAYTVMGEMQPLDTDDLEAISTHLYQLVNACLEAPEPPGKWCITHSRKLDPGSDAGMVVRIDQYLSDLAAYRDDSHLAAWQIHEIEGPTWEALSVLWRNGPFSLDTLWAQLEHRGFAKEEYQVALADLIERGWVNLDEGNYCLTELGVKVREAAEADTDDYFYRPWSCLSDQAIRDLHRELTRLKTALDIGS
jgi:predicted transcriptional regulator